MKPSVSKTVHVDKRPSFAGNLVTIFAGRAERTAETTAMRQNLPGKSHVGRILLNENTSQERLLDMRLLDIHNAQKKTATFIAHQKKTFMNRMEHRQNTWVREHSRRAAILNSLASRKRGSVVARNTEPEDCDGDEESPEESMTEDAKRHASSQIKHVETKERVPHGRSDALPEINSARNKARFPHPKGNAAGAKNQPRLGETEGLSLPRLQESNTKDKATNPANGAQLRPVLITAEGDTDPANYETSRRSADESSAGKARRKKPRGHHEAFEQLRLTGPSPTFISEVLPRIQIRECLTMPAHLSNKSRRRRRKGSTATTTADGDDPLADDRFLRLQHTLAPHLAWKESRDIASIAAGVVNAKKLLSDKMRKISRVDEDFEDG